jgi:diacylglycerol kinase (ATP)
MTGKPARLLFNAAAAKGRAAGWLEKLEAEPGLEVLVPTTPQEMEEQSRRAAEEGLERLLVAGGDGALHYAIQGLAGSSCALGIVPVGSGNDLARALGIEQDPLDAARRAVVGAPRPIDLGKVGDRYFAGTVGLGFDGEVARFVNEMSGFPPGALAYPYALLRTLWRFEPPVLRVEHDGGAFEDRAMLAVFANSPFFGGGMRIAPAAELDDGLLDLVILERVAAFRLAVIFPRVYRGSHINDPRVRCCRSRRATFHADRALTFWADGEPVLPLGDDGVTVEVAPRSLLVIA